MDIELYKFCFERCHISDQTAVYLLKGNSRMNHYASMLRRFAASILPLRSAAPVAEAEPEQPLSLTELISILPGDCDTYHLPLTRGTPVNIDVLADDYLEVRLVHHRSVGATGRPEACCRHALAKATQFVFVCPQTGDYLLQFRNTSKSTTTNAIIAISSSLLVADPLLLEPAPVLGSIFHEATSALSLARWFQSRL